MNSKQLKLGAILSYAQTALSILIGVIYTPLMIRLLGQNEYGLYNTVSSTISALSVLNLGFGASYIRYFSRYKKKQDKDAQKKLNGLFLVIFLVIGLVALLCGLYLTTHLEYVFDTGLTTEEYDVARILMFLLTLSLSISFPTSVFANIISAHEHYAILKAVVLIRTIVSPLVTLPLLLIGYRSIAIVVTTILFSAISDLINLYYVFNVLKCKFSFALPEPGLFKELITYTSFIAINLVVDQINWNIDKMLLARFKGSASVAVYSVGFSLYAYYQSFSTSISGVFTPRIHRLIQETNHDFKVQRDELTTLFTKVGRIQFLILGLIASGVVFFGKPFIVFFWAGEAYCDSYYVAMLLILPASIALIQNLGIEIQRAENLHQFRSYVYIAMAMLNLTLSIILCRRHGAIGSAVGTAFSLIVGNGLIMNCYYHLKCNLNIISFWKSISHLLPGLVFPFLFGIVANYYFNLSNLLTLTFSIIIYSIIYCCSMWRFAMNQFEKELIRKHMISILRWLHYAR